MGKVTTQLRLTNLSDVTGFREGRLNQDQIRSTEIDALVDTGALGLVLPEEVATFLGLEPLEYRSVRFADGRRAEVPFVGGLLLEVLGRQYQTSAYVLPGKTRALVGQIPLDALLRVA